MPDANVQRRGMGSPERSAKRKDTQVENLCYGGAPSVVRNEKTHRLKTCATWGAPGSLLCLNGEDLIPRPAVAAGDVTHVGDSPPVGRNHAGLRPRC